MVALPHPFRLQTMVGEEPNRGLIHFGWLTQLWTVGAKRFEFGEQRAFKGGALGCSCPVPTVKSQHMTPSAPPGQMSPILEADWNERR